MKILDFNGKAQPDPYIIESKGVYYIYCTGADGVDCYKSRDLFNGWELVGTVLKVDGQKEYWAPSVIELDGKFYMYYSSMPCAEEDVHKQNIKVAVCDTPCGEFSFVKDLLEPFSIDAHVVKNDDGLYIFYSINDYEAEKAGTFIVCDKMKDPFNVFGEPKSMVRPTLEEEIFQKDRFKKGQDWYTIEGAFYFKKDDWHYLIYSANSYLKPEYHLGYAVCKSKSEKLNQLDFKKISEKEFLPLLTGNSLETSVGHNSMIELGGNYYLVYHGRDAASETSEFSTDNRTARICRLIVSSGVLKTVGM